MSVHAPLSVTTGSGTLELGGDSLDGGRRLAGGRTAVRARIGLAGLILTTVAIVVSASSTDLLLPESVRPIPSWLAGPFSGAGLNLRGGGILGVLALMFASYVLVLRNLDGLTTRAVLAGISAAFALVLLAPPLFSTDIFSYVAYGRIGSLYASNPYLVGPHAIALDPIYPFIGAKWVTIPTAYGPLFTLLSYPLAALDVAASVIFYKLLAAVSAAVIVAAVWKGARLRGGDPLRAAALVGLNPLLIVFAIGGGHNDLLMLAALSAGALMLLHGRDRAGGATLVVAVGVKLTAAVLIPFALAERWSQGRAARRPLLAGIGMATALIALAAVLFFGAGPINLLSTLQKSQSSGDWHSIPGFISTVLGLGEIGRITGLVLAGAFVVLTGWLVNQVRLRRMDWIDGAGWATVAMLVTASSLLPWYVLWLLPLAALARDQRLVRTAVWITGVMLIIQLAGYLPDGGSMIGL